MKKNMGVVDKVTRIIVAIVIGILFLANVITGTLASVLLGLAIIFLVTSFFSFCPLYTLFGIQTCPKKEK